MYFTTKFRCRKSVGSYDVAISYCSAFDIVVLTFIAYSGKCFDILQCVVRVVYFFLQYSKIYAMRMAFIDF